MKLQLFALEGSRGLGERVSEALGVPLSPHEERDFEDGEHKARPLASVRGDDLFLLHSLHGEEGRSVNDKLVRLLFFIGALRDASAARITAVVPYLAYARKDRRTKPRDPVTIRYLATLFESVGVDRIVVMDVHNLAAFENAFRCVTEHLEARPLFVEHFAPTIGTESIVVVSPDAGGVKRAEAFRQHLERKLGKPVPSAFMEKQRSGGVVSGETLVGPVDGRVAVILDDLISTGTTLARAARACRALGAVRVHAAATHGIFVGDAGRVLGDPAIEEVVVTDTIPPFRLDPALTSSKVSVLGTAPLFAEAIRRMHEGGSLVELSERS